MKRLHLKPFGKSRLVSNDFPTVRLPATTTLGIIIPILHRQELRRRKVHRMKNQL